jgi:hypothetical protein
MADTSKTIKNATDNELSLLLVRIRNEQEALRLLRDLQVRSTANPKGPYPEYQPSEGFSTETPINNGPSIKEMTDIELNEYISRLRKENELLNLISNIRDMNTPTVATDGAYLNEKPYEGISLDTPVKTLYHIGVLGMRWGHRKSSYGPSLPPEMARKRSIDSVTKAKSGAEAARSVATEVQNATKTLNTRHDQKLKDKQQKDASKMSDDELRKYIGRKSLEMQYANLSTKDVGAGKTSVQDFLSVSGNLLAIAATVTGLALTVKQLKGG